MIDDEALKTIRSARSAFHTVLQRVSECWAKGARIQESNGEFIEDDGVSDTVKVWSGAFKVTMKEVDRDHFERVMRRSREARKD